MGIPTVIDRLIQQALLQILTEIFDPDFSPFSFGFRPNRKAHDAIRKVKHYIKEGYQWVVSDISTALFCKFTFSLSFTFKKVVILSITLGPAFLLLR